MESLYILIPLSVIIVFAAIWVFFLASDSGQFDDMVGPAYKILQDDDRPRDESTRVRQGSSDAPGEKGSETNHLP